MRYKKPADKSKWHPLWFDCQKTWVDKFPDWEYKMWTDEDLDELIKTKHPEFLETYNGYPKNINRIDAARYYILYNYGGIYADMDFECLQNFEDKIPSDRVSIAECPFKLDKVQNALMISPKGHPFWEKVFKKLEECKNNHTIGVGETTGPRMLSGVDFTDVNVLPNEKFSPIHDSKFKPGSTSLDTEGLYTRHLSTGVWNK